MLNFKKIIFAVVIACSMGGMSTYSSVATAYELRDNKSVIKDVLEAVNTALASIENKDAKDVIAGHVQSARQFSKEVNVGSLGSMVQRGSAAIISAGSNLKKDNMEGATEALNEAVKEYEAMAKVTL